MEEEEEEEGGRPRSCRRRQFLSGPECSPSCDGALRLRRAAAAAASSRSFSICLLGRPTGFLVWPSRGPPSLPLPPEFSEGTADDGDGGSGGALAAAARLEEDGDEALREDLKEAPALRILECRDEGVVEVEEGEEGMKRERGGDAVVVFSEGGGD